MDEASIRSLLANLQIPSQRVTYTGSMKTTRWMVISCPFAPWTHEKKTDHNPSFGITIKDFGRSSYKCLSCGIKGRIAALPSKLGGYRKKDYSKLRMWAETTEMQAGIGRPVPKWEEADPLTIDSNGNYGATAKIVNGYPQSGKAKALRTKTCTFTLPPAQLAMDAIEAVEVGAVTRLDSQLNADQIIEGTYEILSS